MVRMPHFKEASDPHQARLKRTARQLDVFEETHRGYGFHRGTHNRGQAFR